MAKKKGKRTNNDLQNIAHTTKDRVTRHKYPRVCSTCCKHFPVLSSFMTYHRVCDKINTTGATSGAGIANPSGAPEFTPGFKWDSCYSILSFMCMFCRSFFVLLSLFWSLRCLRCITLARMDLT